ncbi:MAG: SatD family protein [Bacteroidota bacterium]
MAVSKPIAVITGDIIGSSGIAGTRRRKLLAEMTRATEKAVLFLPDFKPEIFQGDSLQGFSAKKRELTLSAALLIIAMLKAKGFNIRISIGLGNTSFASGKSLTSDGTAFQHSGRNMEDLKKKKLMLAVESDHEQWNAEWNVHCVTLNYLLERWTVQQSEAAVETLLGSTQQAAAKKLRIHQSAVQQRLKAAAWPIVQAILKRFESTV